MIQHFDLFKYFSRATFGWLFAVSIALGSLSFYLEKKNLQTTTEMLHYQLTEMLINSVEDELVSNLDLMSSLSKEDLKVSTAFVGIDQKVRKLFKNSEHILKIKIHNLDAKVIYSTDESQIAHQGNKEYIGNPTALSGHIQSKSYTKKDWDSLRGKLSRVELLGSYVPIKVVKDKKTQIIAMAEIYSDVEELNNNILKSAFFLGLGSFLLMILLYIYMLVIVRRGASLINSQSIEIELQKNKLYKSAQLNSLGEMAAGIAHEINNPLTIIEGKARRVQVMLAEKQFEVEKINEQVDQIRSNVKRISTIIKGLKNVSRNGENDPFQEVSLKNIIDETVSLCLEKLKHSNVNLEILITPDDIVLECRYVQLGQCLLNLVTNSYQAIENLEEKKIIIEAYLEFGNVIIKVVDSGSGIPHNIQEKIFDPMFTTKDVGAGTGLGLSITSTIVQQHNGTISIDNKAKSTTFIMSLPQRQSNKQVS